MEIIISEKHSKKFPQVKEYQFLDQESPLNVSKISKNLPIFVAGTS